MRVPHIAFSSVSAFSLKAPSSVVVRETKADIPRDVRDVAVQKAKATPHQATLMYASSGEVETAAPRAVLSAMLRGPWGALVADHLMPRLGFLAERGQTLVGSVSASNHERITLKPTDDGSPGVEGSGWTLRMASGAEQPTFVLSGRFQGVDAVAVVPASALHANAHESSTVHELAGRGEAWCGKNGVDAAFAGHVETVTGFGPPEPERYALRFPRERFDVAASEWSPVHGHRYTNEVSTRFPSFTVRGGAYLGVGAAQNYDHITTAKSEVAFLVDIDTNVANDHEGVLALLKLADTPQQLLSMLTCSRLQPGEENMAPADLLERLLARQPDRQYQDEISQEAHTRLPQSEATSARLTSGEARAQFLQQWLTGLKEGQQLWLTDPERFAHLKFLSQAGRVIVRAADLAGRDTLPAIARQVKAFNRDGNPPLRFNVLYLSNAENWIANGAAGLGYRRMAKNLQALPLNEQGVVLRTGWFKRTPSDGNWSYMTMPMDKLMANRPMSFLWPTYFGTNMRAWHATRIVSQQAETLGRAFDNLTKS
jgi:hypothetical protein